MAVYIYIYIDPGSVFGARRQGLSGPVFSGPSQEGKREQEKDDGWKERRMEAENPKSSVVNLTPVNSFGDTPCKQQT